MERDGRRGCIVLLLLLVVFAAIYFYAADEGEGTSVGPSQGYLPPQ